jgi:hypothetical protein
MILTRNRPCAAGLLFAVAAVGLLSATASAQQNWSAARRWDEQLLAAIRIDKPRPPIHARNLYHVSAAMWDAWAAYDPRADQVFHHERATTTDVEAARAETISYAAYRLIRWRYSRSFNADTTLPILDNAFTAMGYSVGNTSTVGNTPSALGNRIYATIQALGLADGANESGNYSPTNGYAPVNQPLIFSLPGTTMNDPNRWQPLTFSYLVLQNGIIIGASVQDFVCPHWAGVVPFGIRRADPTQPYFDPGLPPRFGGPTDALAKSEFSQVVLASSSLDPADGVILDISPGAAHNNPLGTNDGVGYPVNPVTGLPYAPNPVKRADYARVLAEFWADGPNSETPPGHWNVLANRVADDARTIKRIGGGGPVVNNLEWDVKTYLAVNGAVHDAAVCCWGIKGKYDSVRPISAIRYLCAQGQCSDPNQLSFNTAGVPITPGLIEVVTPESSAPGQRHEHLADSIGEVAIYCWKGQPASPSTQVGGVGWILARNWMPYQKNTFVTPPFAGYTSGHSTFSRSAAEVMARITGSPYFPGGLSTYDFPANSFLSFEMGPSQNLQLQWATYFDAADEAGISRIYGGIHTATDDFTGRILGSRVGRTAWVKALKYFQGRVSCPADFDASGSIGIADIFAFIGAWFDAPSLGGAPNAADFNEDGAVNIQDIFAFLNAWFAGCP